MRPVTRLPSWTLPLARTQLPRSLTLFPNSVGRIVSFTILTRLTPLPPTRRSPVRGRQILSGRLLAATPPSNARLSLQRLLCPSVTGATAPRGALLALVKTKVLLLAQDSYVPKTRLVRLTRGPILPSRRWTIDRGYPMTLVAILLQFPIAKRLTTGVPVTVKAQPLFRKRLRSKTELLMTGRLVPDFRKQRGKSPTKLKSPLNVP